MQRSSKLAVNIAVIGVALGTALVAPAAQAASTWTTISSPKGPGGKIFRLVDYSATPNPVITLTGHTSPNVTSVDIYCFWHLDEYLSSSAPLNPSPIAVSAGAFTANAVALPVFGANETPPCVLRAVPSTYTQLSGSSNTGYVGAFTGPTFYGGRLVPRHASLSLNSPLVGWEIYSGHQQAWNWLGGANSGFADGGPADDETNTYGATASDGFLNISRSNFVPAADTSTRSGILVDGKSAFLPADLAYLSKDPDNTAPITFTAVRGTNGEIVVHERNPVRTCAEGYVDTGASCTEQPSGIALVRTTTTSRGGAVVTFADRFVSTDGHPHTLSVEYANYLFGASYGQYGVKLPGQPYKLPQPDTFASTPTLPHTIFTSTDYLAEPGDLHRTDTGITYSGHPRVYFPNDGAFALQYTRKITPSHPAGITFATETAHSAAEAGPWAAERERVLREHLRVTAPKSPTSADPVAVKGRVAHPVNGYPSKVKVTVGTKSKTVLVSATGRWVAKFSLAPGKHTAQARATDPSGIVLKDRRTFRVL
jgi:hypothetical protein